MSESSEAMESDSEVFTQAHHIIEKNRPLRLNTVEELQVLTDMFARMSHLAPDDGFVRNSYGFPFIPVPSVQEITGIPHPRLAPARVTDLIFGHPIYWIDPVLTTPTQLEASDTTSWAIRMFVVLTDMGLMTADGRYTNVVAEQFGEMDLEEERRAYDAGNTCMFDSVWFDADRFSSTQNERMGRYRDLLDGVISIQRKARMEFTDTQTSAREFAESVMWNDPFWNTVRDNSQEITWELRRRAMDNESIADFYPIVAELVNRVVGHLSDMDRAAVRMGLHSVEFDTFSTSNYSKLLSLGRAMSKQAMAQTYRDRLGAVVDAMFAGEGGFREDTEQQTVFTKTIDDMYRTCRDRLSLAASNHDAMHDSPGHPHMHASLVERDVEQTQLMHAASGEDEA